MAFPTHSGVATRRAVGAIANDKLRYRAKIPGARVRPHARTKLGRFWGASFLKGHPTSYVQSERVFTRCSLSFQNIWLADRISSSAASVSLPQRCVMP